MKTCFIITAYIEGDLSTFVSSYCPDHIICADGGYELAASSGIVPDLVIGDSDSGNMRDISGGNTRFIRFQRDKDESDTFLCVKHAIGLGFDEIIIIGGAGGRFDHTTSNVQTLAHFACAAKRIAILDGKNYITALKNSKVVLLKEDYSYVSIFSLSDNSIGVTTTGLYYPLTDAILNNDYPLGLSNKFIENTAAVEVKNGMLLIVMSKE